LKPADPQTCFRFLLLVSLFGMGGCGLGTRVVQTPGEDAGSPPDAGDSTDAGNSGQDAGDTQAPTVPTGLTITSATLSTVSLSWSPSTDDVAVTGYDVYRDGTRVGSTASPAYTDTGLTPATAYAYAVDAFDAAQNVSAQSSPPVQGTTTGAVSWTLTVTPGGSGTGTVSSTPAGIDCGSTCQASFADRTAVALVAAADPGSAFTGWSGGCSGSGTCSLTLSSDVAVTATFADTQAPTVPTGVVVAGTSTTTVSLSWTASTDNIAVTGYDIYRNGTRVGSSGTTDFTDTGLSPGTAYAYTVDAFDRAGNTSSQSAPPTVGTTQSSATPFTLTVSFANQGQGLVTSNPPGISCHPTCQGTFDAGTQITLSASAQSGSRFSGWVGAGCTGTDPCTFTLDANQAVTAYFIDGQGGGVRPGFFGQHVHHHLHDWSKDYPVIVFGAYRFWDSNTQWDEVNKGKGQYDFAILDDMLARLAQNGVDTVGFTFGYVPTWASCSGRSNVLPCDIDATPGSGLGDGTNQDWIDFVTALTQHVNDPTYRKTHAHIGWWETWNEWSNNAWVNPIGGDKIYATYDQMVRLTEDLRCVLKGEYTKNENTTGRPATWPQRCGKVPVDPSAMVITPSLASSHPEIMQAFLYCTGPGTQPGHGTKNLCDTHSQGSFAVDVINDHYYTNANPPEGSLKSQIDAVRRFLSVEDQRKPFWHDEGSWASDDKVSGMQERIAYVARTFVAGMHLGLDAIYWYAYNNCPNTTGVGTLSSCAGPDERQANPAGIAYQQVFNWLVGATPVTPSAVCKINGTVWTCDFTRLNGYAARLVWDTDLKDACTGDLPASCPTHAYGAPAQYTLQVDLAGAVTPIGPNYSVQIGAKPILLETGAE